MSTRAVLALAAALAFAAFGCQQSTDSESDADEDVAQAAQHLDPADDADDSDTGEPVQIHDGEHLSTLRADPQPQPWHDDQSDGSSQPAGQSSVAPKTKRSTVNPITGHH